MSKIIDFHSHILPEIDDGSGSVKESVAMLRMEAEQGIEHVVATPHFYPKHDAPEQFLERRAQAQMHLQQALLENPGLPKVSVGAEVYFFSGMSDSEALSTLTIDKNGCILLEMPHSPWTPGMYKELEYIHVKQGLIPIIAHVDRYIRPFKTHGIPDRLQDLPVLVQANASFFLDRSTRRMALRMLREGKIHLLGSDCHNLTSRAPNMEAALDVIRQHLGDGALEWISSHQTEVLVG